MVDIENVINLQFWDFISSHINDDCLSLRLKYSKESAFDVQLAITQIEARQKAKDKLPSFVANKYFLFPSLLSSEQCTSEVVAIFKKEIFKGKFSSVCDLTGGLGIDTLSLASVANEVVYVERFADYCKVAEHNFNLFDADIKIVNRDCSEFLNSDIKFDALYIDPARRGDSNKRLFAFSDCEPNVIELLPRMFEIAKDIYIKASPMADISHSINELKFVKEVYVISYKNECKELLFCLSANVADVVKIICVDLSKSGKELFCVNFGNEQLIDYVTYSAPMSYIYEPSSSIMKAGAFKSVAQEFNLNKIAQNSHLYTSDSYISNFPGRRFKVDNILPFSSKNIKGLNRLVPQANISTRNFSMKPDELRAKLKIKEGGDKYIFATTDSNNNKLLILCSKVIA